MNWLKGYESVLDDDRKDNAGLKLSANALMYQNGTIRPRPSMVLYGQQPLGTILGEVYPFVNPATTQNWEISVQLVSGTASVYIRKDGGMWTVCTGKNFSTTAACHFQQVNGEITISNGVDNLSYLNISISTVVPFSALTKPTITSVTQTGLTGTNFTYGYRVTASNQGNTKASVAVTVQVSSARNQWTGGSSQFTTITWPRITGAERYSLYITGADGTNFYYYLDTVPDPGSGTNVVYVDNSSIAINTNSLAPEGDSTAGPRVTRCANILGQMFMTGDTDNPYRVWFGSTGNAALDFSAFDGGGWVDIDTGGRDFPVTLKGFRDGHGNPVATCVMKGTSGHGKLVHVAMTSTTLGTTVITYAAVSAANGQDGTVSPDGVIFYNDSLWYPSTNKFNTTGTSANKQNILTTQNFAQSILPDVLSLNAQQMNSAVGIEYQGRLYFFLPVGSTKNNQAWVCDMNRNGVWTNPWYVNVDWAWLYDSNDGVTHFMALSNNQIYEFSYSQLTTDGATPFLVDIGSGIIKFSPDGEEWGSVIDVTFVYERAQGAINMSVVGYTQANPLSSIGAATFVPNVSIAGWNESGWDNPLYPWDAVVNIPTAFGSARVEVVIGISTELKWLTWEVSSNSSGVDFQLADVIIRFVNIGVIDH